MSLITYCWLAAICGTELGLWHSIILTVSSQQVSHNTTLYDAMLNAASTPDHSLHVIYDLDPADRIGNGLKMDHSRIDIPNLRTLFLAIRDRHSSKPIDKVWAIAFPFQKLGNVNFHVTFPIYDPSTPVSVAWGRLISSITSTKWDVEDFGDFQSYSTDETTTTQLLCNFPHPSKHHWFPSWTQVLQYPDVSIRDHDPTPVPRDMDCSLRIVSGRIYRDCSLELKRRHTSKGQQLTIAPWAWAARLQS